MSGCSFYRLLSTDFSVHTFGVKIVIYIHFTFRYRDGCSNLQYLNISWCRKITNDAVIYVTRNCVHLHHLYAKGCSNVRVALIAISTILMYLRAPFFFGVTISCWINNLFTIDRVVRRPPLLYYVVWSSVESWMSRSDFIMMACIYYAMNEIKEVDNSTPILL